MGGLNPNIILQGTPAPSPTQLNSPAQNLDTLTRLRTYQQQQALAPLRQQQLANDVQEQNLKIQNMNEDQQDAAALQKAMTDPANMTPDPVTGQMVPDHSKVRDAFSQTGHVRNVQAFDKDYLTINQAATALATSKAKADQDRWNNVKQLNQMAGEGLASVIAADPEAKQQVYTDTLNNLKKAGFDTSKYPAIVPSDDALKAQAAGVGYMGTILTNADKAALEEQRKAKATKDAVAAKTAATNAMHAEAATAFQGINNKTDYDQAVRDFAAQDEDHAAYAKRYLQSVPYNSSALNTINRRALTAEQRQQADNAAQKPTITSPIEAALEWAKAAYPNADKATQYDRALARFSATVKDEKIPPGTTGGKVTAQQQKEWLQNFDKTQKSEQEMYGDLQRYEDAINSGQTFLQQTQHGLSASAMDKYTGGDDAKTAAAITDMKQRADTLRDKIAATIKQKYDLAGRLGAEPDVPVDQAISAVQTGKYNASRGGTNAAPAVVPATAPVSAPPRDATPAAPTILPPQAKASLKEGIVTTFGNGQKWTLKNGQPTFVGQ